MKNWKFYVPIMYNWSSYGGYIDGYYRIMFMKGSLYIR